MRKVSGTGAAERAGAAGAGGALYLVRTGWLACLPARSRPRAQSQLITGSLRWRVRVAIRGTVVIGSLRLRAAGVKVESSNQAPWLP